jgi:hypothetical protein
MGERVILVCDVCGQPASDTVNLKIGRRSLVKDLCSRHVAELTAGARRARPGRRRAVVPSNETPAKRRPGRPRKAAAEG